MALKSQDFINTHSLLFVYYSIRISKMCYNFDKMYRLSIIIDEIYLKYLPLAEKMGITLNLDFPDPTVKTDKTDKVRKELDKSMKSALSRTIKGEIKIEVKKGKITVTDSGTTLSKEACAVLSNEHVTVKSKVGFGTTVTIAF